MKTSTRKSSSTTTEQKPDAPDSLRAEDAQPAGTSAQEAPMRTSSVPKNDLDPLEDQIRECFARVVWTHKVHAKAADASNAKLNCCKLAQIIVSGVMTSGALAVIIVDNMGAKLATVLFSLVSLVISAYMKKFDPGGDAEKHRSTAAKLWAVRESYLSLLTDLRKKAVNEGDAMKRRDKLQKQLAVIYEDAPQTGQADFENAGHALTKRNEYSFSDAEIDALLPSSLKKKRGTA